VDDPGFVQRVRVAGMPSGRTVAGIAEMASQVRPGVNGPSSRVSYSQAKKPAADSEMTSAAVCIRSTHVLSFVTEFWGNPI
jgi:hypothetical protein